MVWKFQNLMKFEIQILILSLIGQLTRHVQENLIFWLGVPMEDSDWLFVVGEETWDIAVVEVVENIGLQLDERMVAIGWSLIG